MAGAGAGAKIKDKGGAGVEPKINNFGSATMIYTQIERQNR